MVEFIEQYINFYKIIFNHKKSILKIYIQSDDKKEINKPLFKTIQIRFKGRFKKYFSDFNDMFKKINEEQSIIIDLKEELSNNEENKKYIKCLYLIIKSKSNDKIIISKKIYALNVYYYLTKGPNNERINPKPFSSYIEKEYFNINDIFDKENFLSKYFIDDVKYKTSLNNIFASIRDENIKMNEEIILEFHIDRVRDYLMANLKLMKNYYNNEIIKIKNKVNKYSDVAKNYDLIFICFSCYF